MTTSSLKKFDELAMSRRQQRGTPLPQMPLAQIAPLPNQPRQAIDPDKLNELATSIRMHGVIQPIIVMVRQNVTDSDPIRYSIVCGERRFRAARLAGLDAIPAVVRDYADDEVAVLALLENLQREDLTPLEEAEYLAQLKQKYAFTEEQLGERLGKSRDYIHMRTRLLNLSPDLIETWKSASTPRVFEKLTPSHAILLNQVKDDELRQTLIQLIVDEPITVAETRRRIDMIKQATERDDVNTTATGQRLLQSAVKGISDAEFRLRLQQVAPKPAQSLEPVTGPEPNLVLQDLAMHRLLAPLIAQGATSVAFQELELALKKDLAWVRRIHRDNLAGGQTGTNDA